MAVSLTSPTAAKSPNVPEPRFPYPENGINASHCWRIKKEMQPNSCITKQVNFSSKRTSTALGARTAVIQLVPPLTIVTTLRRSYSIFIL